MVESMTIQEFLDVLSSKEPVPGGGGASALAGALGNALGQMVANLTIGKKKYALVEDEIKELAERMKGIQGQFSALADQDAKVFAQQQLVRDYQRMEAAGMEAELEHTWFLVN